MEYRVKIIDINKVTHNVRSYKVEKPAGYSFIPGQATELSIDKPGWENEKRPFTFTSLEKDPYLEFTIKSYRDHNGVTAKLDELKTGDHLLIGDVWGAIEYKGPGYFIAGGAGITPFIAIFRSLSQQNKMAGNRLFFANRRKEDIIYEDELAKILGKENIVFILSDEKLPGYEDRMINAEFLQQEVQDFHQHFYICGPEPMTNAISKDLLSLGASPDAVVFEK